MDPTVQSSIPFGAVSLTVTDQHNQSHAVQVRLLKIREFPEYFSKAEDEEALAAFVTGSDAAFIDALTVESVLSICEKAHDINFHNACRWANRRANFNEALLPVARKGQKLQQTLGSFAPAAPSSSEKE